MRPSSELTAAAPAGQIQVLLVVLVVLSTIADLISIHLVHAYPMPDRFVIWGAGRAP